MTPGWDESKHKRGQPENAGQFGPGGGGAATAAAPTPSKTAPAQAKTAAPKRRLPAQQRAALDWYTGDGWVQVNAALSGRKDIYGQDPRPASEFATTTKHLDAAILGAGKSAQPMSLFRGVRVDGDPAAWAKGMQVGQTVRMSGYQSTSRKPAVAVASGNVLLRIESDHGLDVSSVSKNPGEGEVLLGHNWEYEVTKVELVEFRGKRMPAVSMRVKPPPGSSLVGQGGQQ